MSDASKIHTQSLHSLQRPLSSSGPSSPGKDQLVKAISETVVTKTVYPWEQKRLERRQRLNMKPITLYPSITTTTEQSSSSTNSTALTPQDPKTLDSEHLRAQIDSLLPEERKEVEQAVQGSVQDNLDRLAQEGLFKDDNEEGIETSSTTLPKTPTKLVDSANKSLRDLFTPSNSSGRSPIARKLDFDSVSSDTSSKSPVGGPNRIAVILLTFAGLLFIAHTAVYGLPSFGKIKGWPGATAV